MSKRLLSEIVDLYLEDSVSREISVRFNDILSAMRAEAAHPAERAPAGTQTLFFPSRGLTEARYNALVSELEARLESTSVSGGTKTMIHSDSVATDIEDGYEATEADEGQYYPRVQRRGRLRFDGERTTEEKKELLKVVKEPEYGFEVHLSEVSHTKVTSDNLSIKGGDLAQDDSENTLLLPVLLEDTRSIFGDSPRLLHEKRTTSTLLRRIKNSTCYAVGSGALELVLSEVTPIYADGDGVRRKGETVYEAELKSTSSTIDSSEALLRDIDWVLRTMYQTATSYSFSALERLLLLTNSWLGVSEGETRMSIGSLSSQSLAFPSKVLYKSRVLQLDDFTVPGLAPSLFEHQTQKKTKERLETLQELGVLSAIAPTRASALSEGLNLDVEHFDSKLTLYYATHRPSASMKLAVISSGNFWLIGDGTASLLAGRDLVDLRELEGTVMHCYEITQAARVPENGATVAKHWLIVDDILSNRGASTMHLGHRDRLLFAKDYAFGRLLKPAARYLEITVKNYRPWRSYADFYEIVRDLIETQSTLPYRSSGLVFMPANRPYHMSTIRRVDDMPLAHRLLSQHADRCEWVPPEAIRIDLRLEFRMDRSVKHAYADSKGAEKDIIDLIDILRLDETLRLRAGGVYTLQPVSPADLSASAWEITALQSKQAPNPLEYIFWVLEGLHLSKEGVSGQNTELLRLMSLRERLELYEKTEKAPTFVVNATREDARLCRNAALSKRWQSRQIFFVEAEETRCEELARRSGLRVLEEADLQKGDAPRHCILRLPDWSLERVQKIRESLCASYSANVLLFHAFGRFCTSEEAARSFSAALEALAGRYGRILSTDIDPDAAKEFFEPYFARGPPISSIRLFTHPFTLSLHRNTAWDKLSVMGTDSLDLVEIGLSKARKGPHVFQTGGFVHKPHEDSAQEVGTIYRLVPDDYIRAQMAKHHPSRRLACTIRPGVDRLSSLPLKFKKLARLYRTLEFTPMGVQRKASDPHVPALSFARAAPMPGTTERLTCEWHEEKRHAGVFSNSSAMALSAFATFSGSARDAVVAAARLSGLQVALPNTLEGLYRLLKSYNIRIMVLRRRWDVLTNAYGELKTRNTSGRVVFLVESALGGRYDLLILTDGVNAQAVFEDTDVFVLSTEIMIAKKIAANRSLETKDTLNEMQFMLRLVRPSNSLYEDREESNRLLAEKVEIFKQEMESVR